MHSTVLIGKGRARFRPAMVKLGFDTQRKARALQGADWQCHAKEMQFEEMQWPGIELTRYGKAKVMRRQA